jgi:hypothetical protein
LGKPDDEEDELRGGFTGPEEGGVLILEDKLRGGFGGGFGGTTIGATEEWEDGFKKSIT